MTIGLITRDAQLYSSKRLAEAAYARGHNIILIDALKCWLSLGKGTAGIFSDSVCLPLPQAIIPRIGSSMTYRGSTLIRQFEIQGVFTTTSSESLLKSRDKLTASQLLVGSGIQIPFTVYPNVNSDFHLLVNHFKDFPFLVKAISSTHGDGIELVKNLEELIEVTAFLTCNNRRYIFQEFVEESNGEDFRIFVIGKTVIASMKRKASSNDFRSNLHLGGSAEYADVTDEIKNIAVKACQTLGLLIGGVDIIISNNGPLVLEVNPSPGLEGIEQATGIDIAGKIISFIEDNVLK